MTPGLATCMALIIAFYLVYERRVTQQRCSYCGGDKNKHDEHCPWADKGF